LKGEHNAPYDSGNLTTPVVADGRVLRSDGGAEAGQGVILLAWPADDVVASMRVGDTVKLQPVATAITDTAGRYKLRIAELSQVRSQAGPDGLVNFEVVTGGARPHAFTRQLTAGTTTMLTSAGVAPLAPAAAEAADFATARTGAASTEAALSAAALSAAPVDKVNCTVTKVQDFGSRWAIVGQTYSTTSGVNMTFTYTQGASSSLGVAYSNTLSGGSWSQSGTNSVSTSTTINFGTASGAISRYDETTFSFGEFFLPCNAGAWYEVKPTSFDGGTRFVSAATATANMCRPYQAGTGQLKNNTTAITWTNGVSFTDIIGISLSAHTGYTTSASIDAEFTATHNLCGANAYPASNSPSPLLLVAKP
jgi:hypothetical protein